MAFDSCSYTDLVSLVEDIRVRRTSSGSGVASTFFANWAKTYSCTAHSRFSARNIDDVRVVLELARRDGRTVRAVGEGHSPSDLVCVSRDDWLLSVDAMDDVLDVDRESHVVTVQAGVRLKHLHGKLAQHGLAMSSLGSISDQSLGGAISTATHGSSTIYGNLSSMVTGLTIVVPDKDVSVVACSKNTESDVFEAARCALGLAGIITSISIQCEPLFRLEEEEFCMTADSFFASIGDAQAIDAQDGLAYTAQHVRAWWFPQAHEVRVSRMNRTQKPCTIDHPPTLLSSPFNASRNWIRDTLLGYHWHQLALLIGRAFPNFLTWHARSFYFYTQKTGAFLTGIHPDQAASTTSLDSSSTSSRTDPTISNRTTPTSTRIGNSVQIFNYDCLFPQYTYEGVVPLKRTQACLREMQSWLERENAKSDGLRHHFPIEVRFSAADDVWMSPTYGEAGCYIGIVQYKPYGLPVTYQKLFEEFERILFAHGGKPHWAKAHSANLLTLTKMFTKLPDFLTVRERCDPNNILVNAYAKRHFLGQWSDETDHKQYKTLAQSLEDKVKSA